MSHHGDWVIFVGDTSVESTARLGVDVMDFQDQVPGESFETFSACFLDQVRRAGSSLCVFIKEHSLLQSDLEL